MVAFGPPDRWYKCGRCPRRQALSEAKQARTRGEAGASHLDHFRGRPPLALASLVAPRQRQEATPSRLECSSAPAPLSILSRSILMAASWRWVPRSTLRSMQSGRRRCAYLGTPCSCRPRRTSLVGVVRAGWGWRTGLGMDGGQGTRLPGAWRSLPSQSLARFRGYAHAIHPPHLPHPPGPRTHGAMPLPDSPSGG